MRNRAWTGAVEAPPADSASRGAGPAEGAAPFPAPFRAARLYEMRRRSQMGST